MKSDAVAARTMILCCFAAVMTLIDAGLWFQLTRDRQAWEAIEIEQLADAKAASARGGELRDQMSRLNDQAEELLKDKTPAAEPEGKAP